jgi:hypothetical protein
MLSKLFKSKTVIVNTMLVVAGTLSFWSGHDVIVQHPDLAAGLVAATGVVNVILRFVTTVPVWEK